MLDFYLGEIGSNNCIREYIDEHHTESQSMQSAPSHKKGAHYVRTRDSPHCDSTAI